MPSDSRHLAAIGRDVSPLSPSAIQAIIQAETRRSNLAAGQSAAPDHAIWWLEAEPFDTRLLIQRHYGRLANGDAIVVRVVRPEQSAESDLALIPLAQDAVAPFLSDGHVFAQSVDDYRASYAAQTDGHALAGALEVLGHDARNIDTLLIPNAAQPQPKRMSKNGVLPPKWCCLDTHPGAERHEDAFALRLQVYQPDRHCALLL
jgi:hypothetical protein